MSATRIDEPPVDASPTMGPVEVLVPCLPDGWRGALRGLAHAHAHVGWLFLHDQRAAKERYVRDLLKDPVIRFVNTTSLLWVLLGLAGRPATSPGYRSRRSGKPGTTTTTPENHRRAGASASRRSHTPSPLAFHGLHRYQLDPFALVIRLLERTGLIWDVVRISPPQRQADRAQA